MMKQITEVATFTGTCMVTWGVYTYRRSDGKSMLNFLTLFHFRLRNPQYMGDSGASQRC